MQRVCRSKRCRTRSRTRPSTAPGSTRPVTAKGEPWRPCGYPGPTLPFRTPCQCAAACDMQQPVRYNFDFTQRIPSPRIHIGRRVLSSSVLLTFTTTTSVLLTPPESTYRSQIANIRRKQLHPLQDLRRTQFEDHWKPSHISFPSWRPRTFRHPQPSRHRQCPTIWLHQMLSSTTKV